MASVDEVERYLYEHGPSRSSLIAADFQTKGYTADAARKRVSRFREPVVRFPVPLLPKKETFLYRRQDRNSERFWDNLIRDLRESGSIYGLAIDGFLARGGPMSISDFEIISGAPTRYLNKQLSAELVGKNLVDAGILQRSNFVEIGDGYRLVPFLGLGGMGRSNARRAVEMILLDALREWARKIGLASYDSIAIRGEANHQPIGSYVFDLGAPSYLLPLNATGERPGFLVADVFAEGTLDKHAIGYFIRKVRSLKATQPTGILALLLADSFTGDALTAGHAAGIVMATPRNLFGSRAGEAVATLMQTLSNAAAYAAANPERLTKLIVDLSEIEGRAGNLRGILFELIVGYLVRREAASIDMGVRAFDPATSKSADIDVQAISNQGSHVRAIECKGKNPGGVVEVREVEQWLEKIATLRAHYGEQTRLREAKISYELWTSGEFSDQALALLEEHKLKRTRQPIDWKDGKAVLALARSGKEKSMMDALNQHFFRHPLARALET